MVFWQNKKKPKILERNTFIPALLIMYILCKSNNKKGKQQQQKLMSARNEGTHKTRWIREKKEETKFIRINLI